MSITLVYEGNVDGLISANEVTQMKYKKDMT